MRWRAQTLNALLSSLVLLGLVIVGFYACRRCFSGEKLRVLPALSQERADVNPGTNLSWTFRLRNNAGARLEVATVIVTCQCIDVQLSTKSIEPGQEAELTVTGKMPAKGDFSGRIYLETKSRESIMLFVAAHEALVPGLEVAPFEVRLTHEQCTQGVSLPLDLVLTLEPGFSGGGAWSLRNTGSRLISLRQNGAWLQLGERRWKTAAEITVHPRSAAEPFGTQSVLVGVDGFGYEASLVFLAH